MSGAGEAPGRIRSTEPDTLLQEFIRSDDPAISERALHDLLTRHAGPQIRSILGGKLALSGIREQVEIEDLSSEVISDLLRRLRRIKEDPTAETIANFAKYTAATTYRAYSDYLRWKYPHRYRLKTQLRYLLQSDERFSLWESDQGTWLCSLHEKEERQPLRAIPSPEEFAAICNPRLDSTPGDFVAGVLQRLSGPIELNDLVAIMARLWGIQHHVAANLDETDSPRTLRSAVSSNFELRNWLARLWAEVSLLPLAQRHALLLNLRDDSGDSALLLVPMAGIASIREIARVLEIHDSELAALWNRLPIDDLSIAERLGLTRQQVINLRKSARARLTRRISKWE